MSNDFATISYKNGFGAGLADRIAGFPENQYHDVPQWMAGYHDGYTVEDPSAYDEHFNLLAQEGIDRCTCGCKYWELDRCVDCGTTVEQARRDNATLDTAGFVR